MVSPKNRESNLRYFALWQLIGVMLIATVIYLSLTPKPPRLPLDIEWGDKLGHFLAYFTLMAWHAQLYRGAGIRLALVIAFIGMGIGLEYLQAAGGVRMFEWADALANSLGALAAFSASYTRMAFVLQRLEQRFIG